MCDVSSYLKELGLRVSVLSRGIKGSLKHGEFDLLINVEKVP